MWEHRSESCLEHHSDAKCRGSCSCRVGERLSSSQCPWAVSQCPRAALQAAEGTHELTCWCSAFLGHLSQVRVK